MTATGARMYGIWLHGAGRRPSGLVGPVGRIGEVVEDLEGLSGGDLVGVLVGGSAQVGAGRFRSDESLLRVR